MKEAFPFARLNPSAGRAVIFTGAETALILSLEHDGTFDGPKPVPEGLHMGMWLQPAESFILDDLGEAPAYENLKRVMVVRRDLMSLLFAFTTAIEGKYKVELRQMAAEEFEVKYGTAHPDAITELKRVLLSTPIPEDMSTRDTPLTGHGKALLDEMVAMYGHRPCEASAPT